MKTSRGQQHRKSLVNVLGQRPEAVVSAALVKLRLHSLPGASDVVAQSKSILRDYIYQHLKRNGTISDEALTKRDASLFGSPLVLSDVSRDIGVVGAELENLFPNVYQNIAKQMSLNLQPREHLALQSKMTSFADTLFKNGVVTWGRVVSLIVIYASLAGDCVQQGRTELISVIVDTFADITARNLAAWIIQQDGWAGISRVMKSSEDVTVLWILMAFGALLGFAITLATTLRST